MNIWSRGLFAAMCGLALAMTGCDSEDTSSNITATRFQLDRDMNYYSSMDFFTWDTTLRQAVATIHIRDFSHGDAMLKVYDAHGKQVFARRL